MKHQDISEGDTLRLKRNNVYGLPVEDIVVADLRYRGHYKTPHVVDKTGRAFEPRDFQKRV